MAKYRDLTGKELWNILKQPLAATIAAVIGAGAAMAVSETGLVVIAPSSAAFITVLLIDSNSAENFYVNSIFRVSGTLIGIAVGAAVAFVSNALVANGASNIGLNAFQLSALAIALFVPLVIVKEAPIYMTPCMIYLYTVTALVFAGTSNAVTVATITSVLGGILIAAVVMYMFHYDSAEGLLFQTHASLLHSVFGMAKLSVRANPSYKSDYFDILDLTRSAFSCNLESIRNYESWRRWTGRRSPPFDFMALTSALRPVYHQTAALFWSLCRESVVVDRDSSHLFSSSQQYFALYHSVVDEIVTAFESAELKFAQVLKLHPSVILAKPSFWRSRSNNIHVSEIIGNLVSNDLLHILNLIAKLNRKYQLNQSRSHPTLPQQWLFQEYIYQLSIVLTELLDYTAKFSEILLPNQPTHLIGKHIRAIAIYLESLNTNVEHYTLPDDEDSNISIE